MPQTPLKKILEDSYDVRVNTIYGYKRFGDTVPEWDNVMRTSPFVKNLEVKEKSKNSRVKSILSFCKLFLYLLFTNCKPPKPVDKPTPIP